MQLTAIIISLSSLAASIQAAPATYGNTQTEIQLTPYVGAPPPPKNPTLSITDFSNSGKPNSAMKTISFNVKNSATGQSAKCSASKISAGFPSMHYYTKCDSNGFGFGFEWIANEKGFLFTVSQKHPGGLYITSGSTWVANKAKTQENKANPSGSYKSLDHAKDFDIRANWWSSLHQ
ncbi:hypothetical protein H072_2427 [Dactylellina haptotyla CBS 200.50]|uniref:AA1-like domain-containing protein n=1 Tax=Dactylellina haptotyla (strain CBS 200.50) TaxID=1284197 RepID=S8C751_DACHA|nr:hypothetical protein H072_2427 [Dactylellina haptotyla CBS 200.50]